MKTVHKFLIIGGALVFTGLTVSITALALNQFDFGEIDSGVKSQTYDIIGDFDSIDVDLTSADLNVYLSNDDTNKAVCLEKEHITFTVEVKDNKLIVVENNDFHISLLPNFTNVEVSLFLNKASYESIVIDVTSGDIVLPDSMTFKNVDINVTSGDVAIMSKVEEKLDIESGSGDISIYKVDGNKLNVKSTSGEVDILESKFSGLATINVTSGDVHLTDIEGDSLNVDVTSGDVELTNAVYTNDMSIETTSGDVEIKDSDAANITIKTLSGDVEGSILTDKIYIVSSSSGEKNVPSTITGGICKITTGSGSINIE